MKRKQVKTDQPLSHNLTKHLLAYAVVAGAVTSCSSHADAEVIFTPVDSKVNGNFEIDLNHGFAYETIPNKPILVDPKVHIQSSPAEMFLTVMLTPSNRS